MYNQTKVYFVKMTKIWWYCSNFSMNIFQRSHVVEADTVFSIENQTIIESLILSRGFAMSFEHGGRLVAESPLPPLPFLYRIL